MRFGPVLSLNCLTLGVRHNFGKGIRCCLDERWAAAAVYDECRHRRCSGVRGGNLAVAHHLIVAIIVMLIMILFAIWYSAAEKETLRLSWPITYVSRS